MAEYITKGQALQAVKDAVDAKDEEYIAVDYPTISVAEKRKLMELCSSTLVNAFNFDDYMSVLAVFRSVVDRLEENNAKRS